MKLSAKLAVLAALLASAASAQFSAELAYLEAGPAVVSAGGRLEVKLRITNTSGQVWEPLPDPACPSLNSYAIDIYQACPTYPSPAVGSNWGKIIVHFAAYRMDQANPMDERTMWWVDIPLPASVAPGETVVLSTWFAAPTLEGSYILTPHMSMFGCCNFTSRILHSPQDGFDLSPHFEFRVASDANPPSLILDGLLAGSCVLWPPNNQMVEVGSVRAVDDRELASLTVTVTSTDQTFVPADTTVLDIEAGLKKVALRATRAGFSTGRIYQVNIMATDSSGNKIEQAVPCTVPHDKGK